MMEGFIIKQRAKKISGKRGIFEKKGKKQIGIRDISLNYFYIPIT